MRVAVKHRCYVLYDSVYQRLDYVGWFVNPAFADPEWRDWVVSLSGLSKMDMFGASTGARACWLVISDQIRAERRAGPRDPREPLRLARRHPLDAGPGLGARRAPEPARRRCAGPRPTCASGATSWCRPRTSSRPLGVERTDFGGTFYAPLAFPGLVGEPFDRLRNGVHEKAVVKDSVDAFELLLSGGVGGIPFVAFAGGRDGAARYGTWQRLSYGSKDVKELAVFMDRVRARIDEAGPARLERARRPRAAAAATPQDAVWESVCTAERLRRARRPRPEGVRRGAAALPRGPAPRGAAADRARSTPTRPRTAPSSSTAPCAPPPRARPTAPASP